MHGLNFLDDEDPSFWMIYLKVAIKMALEALLWILWNFLPFPLCFLGGLFAL